MWNGTMFVDLDGPLNASSLLSASAELLVHNSGKPAFNITASTWLTIRKLCECEIYSNAKLQLNSAAEF